MQSFDSQVSKDAERNAFSFLAILFPVKSDFFADMLTIRNDNENNCKFLVSYNESFFFITMSTPPISVRLQYLYMLSLPLPTTDKNILKDVENVLA